MAQNQSEGQLMNPHELLLSWRALLSDYHSQKENTSLAAVVAQLAAASAFLVLDWKEFSKLQAIFAALLLAAVTALAHAYFNWQTRKRYHAADMSDALNNVALSWLLEVPTQDDLKSTPIKDSKGCLLDNAPQAVATEYQEIVAKHTKTLTSPKRRPERISKFAMWGGWAAAVAMMFWRIWTSCVP